MNLDHALRSLARLPRPQVSPFWSARVAARATEIRAPHRVPGAMRLYWLALTIVGGPLLLTSWQRVALVAAVTVALRLVVVLTPVR
jgi:hypothetical protein